MIEKAIFRVFSDIITFLKIFLSDINFVLDNLYLRRLCSVCIVTLNHTIIRMNIWFWLVLEERSFLEVMRIPHLLIVLLNFVSFRLSLLNNYFILVWKWKSVLSFWWLLRFLLLHLLFYRLWLCWSLRVVRFWDSFLHLWFLFEFLRIRFNMLLQNWPSHRGRKSLSLIFRR